MPNDHILPFTRQLSLAAGLALLLAAWGSAARAQVPHRSIRQPGHQPVDILDRAQFTHRMSHRGWERRSDHFVVVSTRSAAEANRVADHLEQTWARFGKLADPWTDRHRQPTFAIGAVGVLVDSAREVNGRAAPAPGPRLTNYSGDIYLSARGPELGPEDLAALRSEAVRAFVRVAQLDQIVPYWFISGMAGYFAAGESRTAAPSDAQWGAWRQPVETMLPNRGLAADRMLIEGPAPQRDAARDESWVRFLLTAEDARYAPTLMLAIRHAIQSAPQGRQMWAGVSEGVWQPPLGPGYVAQFQPEHLFPDARQLYEQWLADPNRGQLELELSNPRDPELAELGRDMAVVLKLFEKRRAIEEAEGLVRPRLVGLEGSQTLADDTSPAAADPAALSRWLTDPGVPPWATLDGDGSVLVWTDRRRVLELLDNPARPYRLVQNEDRLQLESAAPDGRTAIAWFDQTMVGDRRVVRVAWGWPAR